VTNPSAKERARADSSVRLEPYPSAVYGFLGLRHSDRTGRPHPILSDRGVRQALTHAIDRETLIKAVLGPDAAVPPGPMSRAIWIWDASVRTLPYDTARANRILDSLGWSHGAGGNRSRGGRELSVAILVPSTSGVRRQLAEGIQEMWRRVGVRASVTAVDFPVFQERLARSQFDAMIGAWLDEPSPRTLVDQWTRAGFDVLNYGRYANPTFDSLLAAASSARTAQAAKPIWKQAIEVLNDDAGAVFLYTPTSVAVLSRRVSGVTIDPFSWLAAVSLWQVGP